MLIQLVCCGWLMLWVPISRSCNACRCSVCSQDVTLQNSSAFLQPSTQSGDQIYHPEAAAISEQQSSGGKTSEGIAKPLVFFYADGGSNSSLGYFPHHVGVRKLPSVVILDPVHETQHVMSTTIRWDLLDLTWSLSGHLPVHMVFLATLPRLHSAQSPWENTFIVHGATGKQSSINGGCCSFYEL